MNKCFGYVETIKNGRTIVGCDVLKIDDWEAVHKKYRGCCMRNCAFYKEERDQVRSDKGLFYMTDKQKRKQKEYFDKYYKNKPNVYKNE